MRLCGRRCKVSDRKTIYFYKEDEAFGEFSNFFRRAIYVDGKTWPTSEHYFQAQKFAGTVYEEQVRSQPTPMEAAKKGKDHTLPLRKDWEAVKDEVMRKAVLAKFSQHEDLKAKLLSTGDAILVEHTRNDRYWADGGDGSGKNKLGHILMEVRATLRRAGQDSGASNQ